MPPLIIASEAVACSICAPTIGLVNITSGKYVFLSSTGGATVNGVRSGGTTMDGVGSCVLVEVAAIVRVWAIIVGVFVNVIIAV
jgi:hypothetical protein